MITNTIALSRGSFDDYPSPISDRKRRHGGEAVASIERRATGHASLITSSYGGGEPLEPHAELLRTEGENHSTDSDR